MKLIHRFIKPATFFMGIAFITSCNKGNRDITVAEVNHKNLYLSEIREKLPQSLSTEDSSLFVQEYINQWTMNELLLMEAENGLSYFEKNFTEELDAYRDKLLIERYFEKMLSADSATLHVSDREVQQYIQDNHLQETKIEKLVKLNYIKLGKKSAVYNKIYPLFVDKTRTAAEQGKLVALCGDSIEYLLDNYWLQWEKIAHEIPFQKEILHKNGEQFTLLNFTDAQHRHLVVFLDYKEETIAKGRNTNFEAIRTMLIQEKKAQKIDALKEHLFNSAIKENKITK